MLRRVKRRSFSFRTTAKGDRYGAGRLCYFTELVLSLYHKNHIYRGRLSLKYQRAFTCVLGLVWAMISQPVQSIDFLALEGGTGEGSVDRVGAAAGWLWGRQWSLPAGLHLSGHWELSSSYWDGDEGRTGNDSLVEGGFAPVFRIRSEAKESSAN